jgi:predicted dehydrogenase
LDYEERGNDYPIGYVRWTEGRNFEAVVDLMAKGQLQVKPLITHRFPIEQATQAYEVITGKTKENFLGVLLTYPEGTGKEERRITFPLSSLKPTGPVKLGVLGAGMFANSVLLPAIKKAGDIELVGIASSGGLHAQHAGKKFGFQYATSDDDQIINDPNINAVAILTRHNTHAELVIKALKAGKHVFVEKPLAVNGKQLEAVTQVLTTANHQLLTVGFNRRFSPLAQQLKSQVSTQSVQEPKYIHYRINAGPIPLNHWTQDPDIGGGRIIGEGCHFVDFITFLIGASPVSVSTQALRDNGRYREDNVSMTFTFPDSSIGIVDYLANGDKSFPKERVEVFCAGQIAVLHDFVSLQTVKDGKRKEVKGAQNKGWVDEWKVFAKAIREGGEQPIPYEQLIGVTKATFAAVESLRKRESIKLT